jgi:hypothetical protein
MEAVVRTPNDKRADCESAWCAGASSRSAAFKPNPEMVARRAYEIWQRHGCPADTQFQDWLAAETDLRSRQ